MDAIEKRIRVGVKTAPVLVIIAKSPFMEGKPW
jgi:hypothetical protein